MASIDFVMWGGDLPPRPLLYHYTSATRLRQILEGGELWMSSLQGVNDAREANRWYPSLTLDDESEIDDVNDHWPSWMEELDRALRLSCKVACFGMDRHPVEPAGDAFQFHRGYARARMWDHYAAKHKGACLVFDRENLLGAARSSVGGYGNVVHGPVTYRDRPVSGGDGRLHFNVSDVRLDLSGTARSYVAENYQSLLMTKNLDWASEEEFRILLLEDEPTDEPRQIAFGDALVTVALGEFFEVAEGDRTLVEARGLDPSSVARCVWHGGSPIAVPAGLAPPATRGEPPNTDTLNP